MDVNQFLRIQDVGERTKPTCVDDREGKSCESYAERRGSTKLPYWRQGELNGKPLRWVGDPSHHNYSDSIHGLGQYYTLAAEGEQKARAREAIDALVSYWVDNDLKIAKYDTSLPAVPILRHFQEY